MGWVERNDTHPTMLGSRVPARCREAAPRRALGQDPSALPPTRGARARRWPLRRSHRLIFTMSNNAVSSFPRRVAAPGFPCLPRLGFRTPTEGWAERREAVSSLRRARKARHHVCETRPSGASRNGPRGAPPWRFWARSALAGSAVACGSVARATFAAGCRARSAEGPEPPGHGLRAAAGTPLPAPPSGSSPDDAPR